MATSSGNIMENMIGSILDSTRVTTLNSNTPEVIRTLIERRFIPKKVDTLEENVELGWFQAFWL